MNYLYSFLHSLFTFKKIFFLQSITDVAQSRLSSMTSSVFCIRGENDLAYLDFVVSKFRAIDRYAFTRLFDTVYYKGVHD